MKKTILSLLLSIALPALSVETVNLSQGPGIKIFLSADSRCDYWRLINYYETQHTGTFCGVASSVIILNALELERPYVERIGFPLFTQEEGFFTEAVKNIVKQEDVRIRGMSIPELTSALETFDVTATPLHASDMTLMEFRALVEQVVADKNQYLIANWHRPSLDQEGEGHFSPIAAFNKETDQILVLDVSRYKYPPFWVKTEDFFNSMLPVDSSSGKSRGIIHVSAD